LSNIRFPQSPFVDIRTGLVNREWILWLQNPQFVSVSFGSAGTGTSVQTLHGDSGGNVTWALVNLATETTGSIDLATQVSGVLPVANGGLGSVAALTPNSAAIQNTVVLKEWLQITGTGGQTRYIPLFGAP
jgi:hypothetical protein